MSDCMKINWFDNGTQNRHIKLSTVAICSSSAVALGQVLNVIEGVTRFFNSDMFDQSRAHARTN